MTQLHTPSLNNSTFPFEAVDGNLFTPVCLSSHWDPTQMLKHILPQQRVSLPMDFRPYVKVCKKYITSAAPTEAPLPPSDMVFPSGGEFYPPGRYSSNIDEESKLRILNRPLDKWCAATRWKPSEQSNMYVAGSTLPSKHLRSNADAFVSELAMPKALLRTDIYTCRSENDAKNFQRSTRLFNNPTKQDRYGSQRFYAVEGGLPLGQPMPHGGVNEVPPTQQALTSRQNVFEQPGGTLQQNHERHSHNRPTTILPAPQKTSFVGISTVPSVAPVW
jgi:hypothetical protein